MSNKFRKISLFIVLLFISVAIFPIIPEINGTFSDHSIDTIILCDYYSEKYENEIKTLIPNAKILKYNPFVGMANLEDKKVTALSTNEI